MAKTVNFTLRIEPELVEKARKVAQAEDRTLGNLIRYLLLQQVRNSEKRLYADAHATQRPSLTTGL
jgi:hypothetical protein